MGTAANTAIDDGAVVFFAFTSTGSGILRGDGSSLTSAVKTGDVAPSGSFLGVNSPSISGDNLSFLGEDDGGFGVFKISDGVVTAIARSGDGSPFGNTFHSFGATAISDNAVAFTAAAGGQGAIYVRDGGPLIAIAGPGSLSPVGPLSFLNTFGLAIDDGVVAFNSGYSAGNGVFMGDGTSITPIATTGTPAPNGKFNSFGVPSIGDGRVAFSGTYSGGGQGVFVGNGGLLETVIKNGDMLFGETLTSVFGQVGIDPHGTGNIAFSYTLANGVRGIAIALPVPEPDSITFVLSWLTGLAFFRRRRPLTS